MRTIGASAALCVFLSLISQSFTPIKFGEALNLRAESFSPGVTGSERWVVQDIFNIRELQDSVDFDDTETAQEEEAISPEFVTIIVLSVASVGVFGMGFWYIQSLKASVAALANVVRSGAALGGAGHVADNMLLSAPPQVNPPAERLGEFYYPVIVNQ